MKTNQNLKILKKFINKKPTRTLPYILAKDYSVNMYVRQSWYDPRLIYKGNFPNKKGYMRLFSEPGSKIVVSTLSFLQIIFLL